MNSFIDLTRGSYNKDNDFHFYLYEGILKPAAEADVDTVMFNIEELHEQFSGCERYERAIVKTANKIAKAYQGADKEAKVKLVDYLSKKMEGIAKRGQEKNVDTQNVSVRESPIDRAPENKRGILGSFSSMLVKFLALQACVYAGRSIYSHMQTAQIKNTVTAIQKDVEKGQIDLCQVEAARHICQNNLGILRDNMPQVDGTVKTNYVNFKRDSGHAVRQITLKAANLTPVQAEMNAKIVGGMVESALKGGFDPCSAEKYGPILVAKNSLSESSHVIDGHHRFAACHILGGKMEVLQIQDDPQKVLKELEAFPGVTRASMSSMNYEPKTA